MSEQGTYTQAAVPINGRETVWLATCDLCGSVVLNQPLHDKWHRSQKAAHIIGPGLFP